MSKKRLVKIKRGLITDPKHRNALGIRIWLYLYMLDRTNWESGIIYDWKDKEEATDMEISWRTLQDQRQQLDKDGYITCVQKKDHQEIIIHNWVNPREYSGTVYNSTENDVPHEGTGEGTGEGVINLRTPTSNSQITNQSVYDRFIKVYGNFSKKEQADEWDDILYKHIREHGAEKINDILTWVIGKHKQRDSALKSIISATPNWGKKDNDLDKFEDW